MPLLIFRSKLLEAKLKRPDNSSTSVGFLTEAMQDDAITIINLNTDLTYFVKKIVVMFG